MAMSANNPSESQICAIEDSIAHSVMVECFEISIL